MVGGRPGALRLGGTKTMFILVKSIPALVPSKGVERQEYDRRVVEVLRAHDVELVCLAGFMRLLSGYFIREFPLRILNIHPSLLPSFPGLDAQHQALEHGVKFSGCHTYSVVPLAGAVSPI